MCSNREAISRYYHLMRRFFDLLSDGNGFYNIGWLPPEGGGFSEGQRLLVEKIATPLKQRRGWVLESGSGQGGPTAYLRDSSGLKIVGLELLKGQVEVAATRSENRSQFVQGDACRMPFGDATFNAAYCIESAFHYPDKAAFVRECARVLEPGGILSLADIMRKPRGSKMLSRLVARAFGAAGFFTKDDYQLEAAEAGLDMIHCEDLTDGVARSFRIAADRISGQWGVLRKTYPTWMLAAFILTGWTLRFVHRWGPEEYRWLVFQKGNL